MKPSRVVLSISTVVAALAVLSLVLVSPAAAKSSRHASIDCSKSSALCTEVANSDDVFGHYVGHDEPSLLFDSTTPGSGNHMSYNVTLPTRPVGERTQRAGQVVQLRAQRRRSGSAWRCATRSRIPEQVKTCPARQRQEHPRSGRVSQARGPGLHGDAVLSAGLDAVADMASGRGRQLLRRDPVVRRAQHRQPLAEPGDRAGRTTRRACSQVGEEYVNFAFITKSGVPQAPANPVERRRCGTFTPDARRICS